MYRISGGATLQLMSLRDDSTFVEVFFMKPRCVPLGRPHRCRCEWPHHGTPRAGARLRAGQGDHRALPSFVTGHICASSVATSSCELPRVTSHMTRGHIPVAHHDLTRHALDRSVEARRRSILCEGDSVRSPGPCAAGQVGPRHRSVPWRGRRSDRRRDRAKA